MQELLTLNPEHASEDEVKTYRMRNAARAIVTDETGNVALLHIKDGYYKLPGGGIEEGEDKITALRRECEEEIGCDVDVTGEVGIVIEYRKFLTLKQISYCYTARVKGEKGTPNFTELELERGFEAVWVSYDDALRLLEESAQTATNMEGKLYIVPRDTRVLVEGKVLL